MASNYLHTLIIVPIDKIKSKGIANIKAAIKSGNLSHEDKVK